MAETSVEMTAYTKMVRTFKVVALISLIVALAAGAISLWMFNLGTPPFRDGELQADLLYTQWLLDHQQQLMFKAAGLFYWTEIDTAWLSAGSAAVFLIISLYLFQLLVVAKIAKVTAKAFASS